MSELTLIEARGVTKDYVSLGVRDGRLSTLFALALGKAPTRAFRALENVSFTLNRGESLGLVGENGAGKSTLLKILAGVVKPSAGEIVVRGKVSALLELGSGFHPDYAGRENIFLAAALLGLSRRETLQHVDDIIAFADIGAHIDEPVKHYSSGMVVRLGFAIATVLKPQILITDEVLAVGDESFQKKCIRWMEQFLANGGTLLLCSHSMYHVQSLCQHALWLKDGRTMGYGPSHEVTRDYLAYHDAKNAREPAPSPALSSAISRVTRFDLTDMAGRGVDTIEFGESLVLHGEVLVTTDDVPVVSFGIVRSDGIPVYGTFSHEAGFAPTPLGDRRYAFRVILDRLELIPGGYTLRLHVLDHAGLRLFDTVERKLTVRGTTRDMGVVRLAHRWLAP